MGAVAAGLAFAARELELEYGPHLGVLLLALVIAGVALVRMHRLMFEIFWPERWPPPAESKPADEEESTWSWWR